MANNFQGTKYEATAKLSLTDVAKLCRADIKAAVKAGTLPQGLKVSVRTDYYAGGASIRVAVTALPAGFPVLNAERVKVDHEDPHTFRPEYHYPRYTPEATALLKTLAGIFDAYNFDNSDSMTDYFHTRFGDGRPKFEHELEEVDRAAVLARFKAETADAVAVATDAALEGNLDKAAAVLAPVAEQLAVLDWRKRVTTPGTVVAAHLVARLPYDTTVLAAAA